MLSSFSAVNNNTVTNNKYKYSNSLLDLNFNNFNGDEKSNLKTKKDSNPRLSQDSTLVSFQKPQAKFNNNPSSRKFSEQTLLNDAVNENYYNMHPLTETILALYTKYIHYLKRYRSLGDIDDLQYTILSSKFFQTNVSDLQSTSRVFSIPLKESIINLKPKTPEGQNDIEKKLMENNILEISTNSLKSMYKLDTITVVSKIRKILKNQHNLTLIKMDKLIHIFDESMNHNTKILKKNQMIYKQYLSNFIRNLDSYNHKIESLQRKNLATQQIVKSSTTPIMIKIIMAIEKLLENNINLSSEFWSFYIPMYLSLNANGIKRLLQLDFDMKMDEYLIKFRKLTQLFLLFLIPSNNEIINKANMEIWATVIDKFNYTINDKGYLITKIIVIFNDINLKMKNGKNMLNDCELLDWFEKKHVDNVDYDMTTRSDTYEYSDLMQRIPEEVAPIDNNVLGMADDDKRHYADLQTTLNGIITSMSMNLPIDKVDSDITEFLNQWTAFKLQNGITYNTKPESPVLNSDPFGEFEQQNIEQGASTPLEKADPSRISEVFSDEQEDNTFLNNLKTLSDVELNNKLQLKLKELHIENMQNQETKFKKASQLHLRQISLIDKREKPFMNLKEDEISSYYQLDYLKVHKQ